MARNRRSAKQAGARFEKACADYLAKALNDPRIERRVRNGAKDRGDINGVMLDGHRVCIEVKNTTRMDIPKHLREAETEAGNDDALFFCVVQKRRGIGMDDDETMGSQLVIMTLRQYALMLNHGQELGGENDECM